MVAASLCGTPVTFDRVRPRKRSHKVCRPSHLSVFCSGMQLFPLLPHLTSALQSSDVEVRAQYGAGGNGTSIFNVAFTIRPATLLDPCQCASGTLHLDGWG